RRRRRADGGRPDPPPERSHGRPRSRATAPREAPPSDKVRPMTTDPKLDQLKRLLGEVDDLRKAATLLFWDQRVMMPPGGAQARADALATVGRLTHERFVDPELGS